MLWLIDGYQNKVSADQYNATISLRLQAQQFFRWIAGLGLVITLGEEEGSTCKGKFRRKFIPGTLVTFRPTYSLHNRILIFSDIAYVISTIGYNFLEFNRKNSETTR